MALDIQTGQPVSARLIGWRQGRRFDVARGQFQGHAIL